MFNSLGARDVEEGAVLAVDILNHSTSDIAHTISSRNDQQTGAVLVPVAHSLRAMNHADSHANGGGQMAVAQPITQFGDMAGTLTARHDSSPCADRGMNVVAQPMAMNLRRREGGAMPELDELASLRAASGGSSRSYVAFSCKDHGADAGDIAPTLRSMGHDGSHANGGGQIAVAFHNRQDSDVSGDITPALGAKDNGMAVAFTQNQRDEVRTMDVAGALASEPGTKQQTYLHYVSAVRRLTPVECERLQGFPDNYTNIPWRKKPESPDGPRYKALGNSWAVLCVRWIGQRIDNVLKNKLIGERNERD